MNAESFDFDVFFSNCTALKHLDISENMGLTHLPYFLLQACARLTTFKCNNCSLVLPPQRLFSSPERNPGVIQEILGGKMGGKLNLSESELTSSRASDAASFIRIFPKISHLDLSKNPRLSGVGVASILSSFSGDLKIRFLSVSVFDYHLSRKRSK
jgi:hypothetical protein